MTKYFSPQGNFESLNLGKERSEFIIKLVNVIRAGSKCNKNDWTLLFEYYKIGSYFTKESLAQLVFDLYTKYNRVPVIDDSTIEEIFVSIICSNHSLPFDEFLDIFLQNTDILIKIYDFLQIDKSSISLDTRLLVCQLILNAEQYEMYSLEFLWDELASSLTSYVKNEDNKIENKCCMKNETLGSFEYVVEFTKPINIYTFPLTLDVELKDSELIHTHCSLYRAGVLPLDRIIYPKDSVLVSGFKNVGSQLTNTASDINEKLQITSTLGKGKDYCTDQLGKVKSSEAYKKTTESVGNFFSSLKKSLTGEIDNETKE